MNPGNKRLLLISNSTLHGSGYLDHVENEIRDFLGGAACVAFIPFAMYDRRAYAAKTQERFRAMGCQLTSVHDVSNARRVVERARDLRGGREYLSAFEGII